jgi:hypothetical protein
LRRLFGKRGNTSTSRQDRIGRINFPERLHRRRRFCNYGLWFNGFGQRNDLAVPNGESFAKVLWDSCRRITVSGVTLNLNGFSNDFVFGEIEGDDDGRFIESGQGSRFDHDEFH